MTILWLVSWIDFISQMSGTQGADIVPIKTMNISVLKISYFLIDFR
jgi:hypothetical protein